MAQKETMVKKSQRFLIISIIALILGISIISYIVAVGSAAHPAVSFGHGGDQIDVSYKSGDSTLDATLADMTARIAALPTNTPTTPVVVTPTTDSHGCVIASQDWCAATSSCATRGTTCGGVVIPPQEPTVNIDLIGLVSGGCPEGYSWIANIHSNAQSYGSGTYAAANNWLTLCVKTDDRSKKDITSLITSKICQWGTVNGDSCPSGYSQMITVSRPDTSRGCSRYQPKIGPDTRDYSNGVNGGTLLFCSKGDTGFYSQVGGCTAGDSVVAIAGEGNEYFCKKRVVTPGAQSSQTCGNGVTEGSEACDGEYSNYDDYAYCGYAPAYSRCNAYCTGYESGCEY